ncbi:MAG: nuclear transport factor 2 family protein [Phormidium sp. GEM2.Bin31]|nr:MAG: nuclear transport factor 2 family protein [Phormidium sp. GEM2.Bin31]
MNITTCQTAILPDLDVPVVIEYFQFLNAGDCQQTAQRFAAYGELHPPFQGAIVGVEAIQAYLEAEAQGLTCFPEQATVQTAGDGCQLVQVRGHVKTPYFSVPVTWTFNLNAQAQIERVEIRLLASPEQLLELQQFS